MLTKIEVKQTILTTDKTSTDIIFPCIAYTLRQCDACGCEYRRRETLVQCCSNVGPPSSMATSVWRLVASYPAYVDKTVIPCLIFKINNFATLKAIIILFLSLFSALNKVSGDIYYMSVRQ